MQTYFRRSLLFGGEKRPPEICLRSQAIKHRILPVFHCEILKREDNIHRQQAMHYLRINLQSYVKWNFSFQLVVCNRAKYSSKARFKRRILHVPNLMQISANNRFFSFVLDSTHVKCDV